MPFKPLGDRHAIQEVVFILNFTRPITQAEGERIAESHERWRAELPKMERPQIHQFIIGDQAPPAFEKPVFLQFNAFRRNGDLDWRLNIQENFVAVNCLSYTRWDEVWARARSYLDDVGQIINGPDLALAAISLQYIDIFTWDGEVGNYDLGALLDRESPLLTGSVFGKGPYWHLHQGWFRHDNLPIPGQLLERTNLEGIQGAAGPIVKIDNVLQLALLEPMTDLKALFDQARANLDAAFDDLHLRNKQVIRTLLLREITERIALDG